MTEQTTVTYEEDVAAWVEQYADEYETSKASAFRYAVRQQLQREQDE